MKNPMSRLLAAVAALGVVLVASGTCAQAPPASEASPVSKPAATASNATLVVYSGRAETMVGELLADFTKQTGVRVDVRYNDSGPLAMQVMAEGDASPADVLLLQDSGYLGALAGAGRLAALPDDLLAQVDARFRDKGGRWIGTSGRARVLVFNPGLVAAGDMPRTLADLASPQWKGKLAWAPSNASFHAHVSALRHLWGEEKTRQWLRGVMANAPVTFPKNAPQVLAVGRGEVAIGWVNHYYLHELASEGLSARNASFPVAGDAGNILMVSGAAVREGTPRRDLALRLVEWLVGPEAQEFFAKKRHEYPTRPGIEVHGDVRPLTELGLADIAQEWCADVGPTLAMLRELGLQ